MLGCFDSAHNGRLPSTVSINAQSKINFMRSLIDAIRRNKRKQGVRSVAIEGIKRAHERDTSAVRRALPASSRNGSVVKSILLGNL